MLAVSHLERDVTAYIQVTVYNPELNVLTAAILPTSCGMFDDSITLRMTGLQRPTPLVLSWRKVPGATRYYVQVCLVQAAPGQTITPDSQVNVVVRTMGLRYTLDAAMPAGTYEWRTAAVNAHGSVISRWTCVDGHFELKDARRGARPQPATPQTRKNKQKDTFMKDLHGRQICRAQRPRCVQCPLRDLCLYGSTVA
jgi:hypothetical protein